jgi:hypothetical protein
MSAAAIAYSSKSQSCQPAFKAGDWMVECWADFGDFLTNPILSKVEGKKSREVAFKRFQPPTPPKIAQPMPSSYLYTDAGWKHYQR